MATLIIEATPSEKLKRYKLAVDGKKVKIKANNKGTFPLPNNTCGDGSDHLLGCALHGPAGSTLAIKMTCDGIDIPVPVVEIFPEVAPLGGGTVEFKL